MRTNASCQYCSDCWSAEVSVVTDAGYVGRRGKDFWVRLFVCLSVCYPAVVGEARSSSARLRTYVPVYVCVCVCNNFAALRQC